MKISATLVLVALMGVGVSTASAVPIVFSDSTPDNIGSNGTRNVTFALNAATDDLTSVQIQLDVGEVDEGFELLINGTSIFDVPRFDTNAGGPVGVSPGLYQPWNDDGSRPRIITQISTSAITLTGLLLQGDPAYAPLTLSVPITLPTFSDGVNTIGIKNNNSSGPGGTVNMAISGSVQPPSGPPPPTPVAVPVPNFDFELNNAGNPSTAKREMDQVMAWTNQSGTTGVENYGGGGTVGPMAAYMGNNSAFYQILTQPVAEGETYTLTYDGRTNCCGGNTLRASFFYDNGGHVEIAGVATPSLGGWTTINSLTFTAQAGQGYIGQDLGIKFEAPTDWMGVDNVRLTVTAPATVIPEPMTMLAVGLGISSLGGYIRKRRRA